MTATEKEEAARNRLFDAVDTDVPRLLAELRAAAVLVANSECYERCDNLHAARELLTAASERAEELGELIEASTQSLQATPADFAAIVRQ